MRKEKRIGYVFNEDEVLTAINGIHGGKALAANGIQDTLFNLSQLQQEFVKDYYENFNNNSTETAVQL